MPRRPILLALLVAGLATLGFVWVVRTGQSEGQRAAVGQPAPAIAGTTLDGGRFDLTSKVGHPTVINFWGPSCVPCREEFPLLEAKSAEHAADGLAVVGVLTDDPVEPARSFASQYGATWPTVVDPGEALKAAYRVAGRPQTYFVDRKGVLRSIQIGQMQDADFERQYRQISN
jgi:cytochrome c biogenesis protein CcmG, thiol:disulfide interchange protein DsbE